MEMAFPMKKAQIQQSNVHNKPGMKCYKVMTRWSLRESRPHRMALKSETKGL